MLATLSQPDGGAPAPTPTSVDSTAYERSALMPNLCGPASVLPCRYIDSVSRVDQVLNDPHVTHFFASVSARLPDRDDGSDGEPLVCYPGNLPTHPSVRSRHCIPMH